MTTILLVEPSDLNRRALARYLSTRGVELVCVASDAEALRTLALRSFDAALVTWRHVDAPAVLAECDRSGVPARIFSGWPAEPEHRARWIMRYDLGALDAFLGGLATARAS